MTTILIVAGAGRGCFPELCVSQAFAQLCAMLKEDNLKEERSVSAQDCRGLLR